MRYMVSEDAQRREPGGVFGYGMCIWSDSEGIMSCREPKHGNSPDDLRYFGGLEK